MDGEYRGDEQEPEGGEKAQAVVRPHSERTRGGYLKIFVVFVVMCSKRPFDTALRVAASGVIFVFFVALCLSPSHPPLSPTVCHLAVPLRRPLIVASYPLRRQEYVAPEQKKASI